MDKFKLICDNCEHIWICEVDTFGDVDWNCPKCKSSENVSMLEYTPDDPNFYDRKIKLGDGGALHV